MCDHNRSEHYVYIALLVHYHHDYDRLDSDYHRHSYVRKQERYRNFQRISGAFKEVQGDFRGFQEVSGVF